MRTRRGLHLRQGHPSYQPGLHRRAGELCWTAAGAYTPTCGTVPSGATSYGYDNAGNLTSTGGTGGGLAADYTLQGQTATVTPPGGSPLVMRYYDASSDQRRRAGGLEFSYTALGLSGQNPAGTWTQSDWYLRDPSGQLLTMVNRDDTGKDLYYLFDGLGSVAATTNTTGTIVNRYTYEPYGQQTSPDPSAVDSNGNPVDRNPWRYAAGYYDTTTGMLKYGTRYYQPHLTRWTQIDPVAGNPATPMTLNPYTYVGCNPTNNVDPTGRDWSDDLKAFGSYVWACAEGAQVGATAGGIIGTFVFPAVGTGAGAGIGLVEGCTAAVLSKGIYGENYVQFPGGMP